MRAEAGPLLAAVVLLGCSSSLPGRIEAASRDADSTRATSAIADTTRRTFPPPPSGIDLGRLTVEPLPQPPEAAPAIDVTAERKLGAASLEDVIRFHRAVILDVLPVSGPTEGALALPDGGGAIRLGIPLEPAQRTTDEPLIGSIAYGWGAPWMAFALGDPRAEEVEALDLDSLRFPLDRPSFRGPGEALTRLLPRGPAFSAPPGDTAGPGVSRTTLIYQRGGGNAQLAGIRLQTTAFRRRLYAAYTRNEANGWSPLLSTKTSRYALRAELGRVGVHRFELEGALHERTIEDSVSAGALSERPGRSEWDRRRIALSASHQGERFRDTWRVGFGTEKETWILSTDLNLSPQAGSREHWEFPTLSAEGSVTWRPASKLTWLASLRAASRKVLYRGPSVPEIHSRFEDARAHAGVRLELTPQAGMGLDGAYDVRETQPSFSDARASLWGATGRARGRLDLESAHERPTWVDLLTPATLHDFVSPQPAYPLVQSLLFRSGDPGLRPRRLSGPVGSAGITPFEGFDLELYGSYRRLTDDFGWKVSADTSAGLYDVSSIAGPRGSGWVSHAALAWDLRRGPFRLRGVGWIRGGPDSLSPQAGSPPRRAVEAALEWRPVLFKGDLPLHIGVASHASGPRRGLIREAGQVTWDGSLSADFGSAGAFLRVRDVFDRRPGSAIWDPAFPAGAPTPGRTIQAGIAWSLLD